LLPEQSQLERTPGVLQQAELAALWKLFAMVLLRIVGRVGWGCTAAHPCAWKVGEVGRCAPQDLCDGVEVTEVRLLRCCDCCLLE